MAITINRTTSLDGAILPEFMPGLLYMNENQAHKFVITCTRGGSAVTLTGGITGRFMRADGQTILLSGSISSGKANLTLPQSCYIVPGRFTMAIFNVTGNAVTTIYALTGNVARTQTDTLVDPGNTVPTIDNLLDEIDAMRQATADANAAATKAVRYDTTQSLTTTQKTTARNNIDAADVTSVTALNNVVSKNNDSSLLQSGYISSVGEFFSDNNYLCTGYLDVDGLSTIIIKKVPSNAPIHIHLFDSEYNQTAQAVYNDAGVAVDVGASFTSAKYIRLWTKAAFATEFYDCIGVVYKYDSDTNKWCSGHISNSGVYAFSKDYTVSPFIPYAFLWKIVVAENINAHIHYYTKNKEQITLGNLNVGDNVLDHNVANCYYVRVWFNGTHAIDHETYVNVYYGVSPVAEKKPGIIVIGDSWSDTDPEHTSYTKWPIILARNVPCNMYVYAQNGSSFYGETPVYGTNGNVKGQVNAAIADSRIDHDSISLIIAMGGVNDYRQGISASNVAAAFVDRIGEMKAEFTNARVVCFINNQVYITDDMWEFVQNVKNTIRKTIAVPAYSMIGWVPSSNYITDLVHVDDDGYKMIAANVEACCFGGGATFVENEANYTITDGGVSYGLKLIESFSDDAYEESVSITVPDLISAPQSLSLPVSASDRKLLCMMTKYATCEDFDANAPCKYKSVLSGQDANRRGTSGAITIKVNNGGVYAGRTVD